MKKIQSLLLLTLSLLLTTACTQNKRKGPTSVPIVTPKNVSQQNADKTNIHSHNPNADFAEREKIIESLQQILQDMECQVIETNLACPLPENQSKSEDLFKLLESYNHILVLQIDSGLLSPEKKATYQIHLAPIAGYLNQLKDNSKILFLADNSEIYYATQSLESLGIKFKQDVNYKTSGGISRGKSYMVVSNTLLAYKTPTQVVKEISNYIETVEWFLNIYSGSPRLSKDEIEGYLSKVAQLEDLIMRVQKIGSLN